jgi:rubredoxin
MEKWYCTICGYIYDPKEGDLENDILPGTDFLQLPDTWGCVFCDGNKSGFEKVQKVPGNMAH